MSTGSGGAPGGAAKKRILVVEDDAAIVTMLKRVLGSAYEVDTAADGMDGLSRATRHPFPDLIISDVMMPRLDGYSMVARLRKTTNAKIPVIFLTAKNDPKSVVTGITVGARHYVTKPFKVDDLLDKVKRTLGG